MNNNAVEIYKMLKEIFSKPYRIKLQGIAFGRDLYTFTSYIYILYHGEKICISQMNDIINSQEEFKLVDYKIYDNNDMHYLPKENVDLKIELLESSIYFRTSNNDIVFTYYDKTFFPRDGINNNLIYKATQSEFERKILE